LLHRSITLGAIALCLTFPAVGAEEKYISDDIEVTLRSGTSTTNSIVDLLRSGDPVVVIEEDLTTQYSLVETADNKRGYVLTRFLMDQPSARETLIELQALHQTLQSRMAQQQAEVERLDRELTQANTDNENLKNTLRASEQELGTVRSAAADTLDIIEQNQRLQTVVAQLQKEKDSLEEQNTVLRDSTRLDWFIRGGAVALVALLIGILVTRIRWRKNDSWGSY
jgi:SH3 domain protein